MSVEIGTEAAQFPEKEYINGIFVAVHAHNLTQGRKKTVPELWLEKIRETYAQQSVTSVSMTFLFYGDTVGYKGMVTYGKYISKN
jgi:hypothetical protein